MPNARDRRRASFRRAHGECAIRKNYEPHAIVIRRDNFGEPCGHIRIKTETIEPACTHAAQTPSIERDEHVEMLILSELPSDMTLHASRGFPIDARNRIALDILAKLMQL